jgi:hypothetical protein
MRLPVSGFDVSFRVPNGHDDLAIVEAGVRGSETANNAASLECALHALSRLAKLSSAASAGSEISEPASATWASLSVTDFEAALLGLRRFLLGDTVHCVIGCACTERMEIDFSITDLLGEVRPDIPQRVKPSTVRPGWFEFHSKPDFGKHHTVGKGESPKFVFRLPTVADQIAALRSPAPYRNLVQRCIETHQPGTRHLATAERAMEALSPPLSRPIDASCVACGAPLSPHLNVPSLVLHDLRASAAHVHREVHTIASAYHWDESAILSLPQLRRHAYTDAIQQAGAA